MLRSRLFVAAGRIAARMPHFAGRNRAVLSLLPALGLAGRHLIIDAWLSEPVPYRARLDMHSWLQRLAFVNGGYEPETVRLLARLLEVSPGYLLDIGANVGLISIPAARLTGRKVFAVEAVADNIAALKHNIELNGAQDSVEIIDMAVGDVPGQVEIQVEGNLKRGEGSGTANILAADSAYVCERITIQVTTLDDLLQRGRIPADCGVIKIDTDGYDLKVVLGGANLIAASRPVIFGEFAAGCLVWHGQSVDDVRGRAHAMGYRAFAAVAKGRFSETFDSKSFLQDLLLVPQEKVELLAWCLAQ